MRNRIAQILADVTGIPREMATEVVNENWGIISRRLRRRESVSEIIDDLIEAAA